MNVFTVIVKQKSIQSFSFYFINYIPGANNEHRTFDRRMKLHYQYIFGVTATAMIIVADKVANAVT